MIFKNIDLYNGYNYTRISGNLYLKSMECKSILEVYQPVFPLKVH